MAERDAKRELAIIGCVLSYLAAAFFAFYEVFWIYVWIDRTLYVMKWGAENVPREAEYADGAVLLAMVTAILLALLLALAIYLTRKLPKHNRLTVGCAVGWTVSAVLAWFEFLWGSYLVKHLPKLSDPDYANVSYLAKNCRETAVLAVLIGVILLAVLALAVYCTIKLRKRGEEP